jgi:hypothetical protein
MSSPHIPAIGPGGSAETPQDAGVPETVQSTAPVSIGKGFKNQQDSVDRAATNVSSLPVNTKGDDSGTFHPWGPADLAARQMKGAAHRQSDCDAEAASPTPLVKDIAVNKPAIAALTTPHDVAADSPSDKDNPVSDVVGSIGKIFDMFFQFSFLANLGYLFAGETIFDSLNYDPNSDWLEQEKIKDALSTPDYDQPVKATVRRWTERLMQGGELKEVIMEQLREEIKNVQILERRRIAHVYTDQEVSQGLRRHGIMPDGMPNQDVICAKVAKEAQKALEELSRMLRTGSKT